MKMNNILGTRSKRERERNWKQIWNPLIKKSQSKAETNFNDDIKINRGEINFR